MLFWYGFMIKNNDFDRVILFVDLEWLKSIDFTGVSSDWCVANRCVLMCYFFIKYDVFGRVRWKPYFIRVWGDFWWNSGNFWWCEKWWKWRKMGVLSKSLPKWCFGFGLGEMSRKCQFYKGFVDWIDMPVYMANKRS